MRITGVSQFVHSELLQSLEAWSGHVLLSLLSGPKPIEELKLSTMLHCIGIKLRYDGVLGLVGAGYTNKHISNGIDWSRLALTDRNGMFREFDKAGNLIARLCHNLGKSGGCPKYLSFHTCGCACPYMHFRTKELGKHIMAVARGETVRPLTGWHRDVALKKPDGTLSFRFPFVDGVCVTPSEWNALNPGRERPQKDRAPTPEEQCTQIHPMTPETIKEVDKVRDDVARSWKTMNGNWS